MKYFSKILIIICACLAIIGCGKKDDAIRVGTIAGPETALMQIVKEVAKKKYGLNIKIVEFTDYNLPNIALNDSSIDANAFQHPPYLSEVIKNTGFKLVAIGKTIIYPMGAYSKRIKTIDELRQNGVVAIPNDPSNQARALLLLEEAKLIKLSVFEGALATPEDITENPKQLVIKPMDAALITRIIPDVDLALVNTTFSAAADLLPKRDALFMEGSDSLYSNIIVVRAEDKDKPDMKKLAEAFQSPEVEIAAEKLFKGQAIPAWK
jgi:D-methionine transport system substrate-binding protein